MVIKFKYSPCSMEFIAKTDCVSVLYCADASGPGGLQGATFSVLLMVAWTSVIKGFVDVLHSLRLFAGLVTRVTFTFYY